MKIVPVCRADSIQYFCRDTDPWEIQNGYDKIWTNHLRIGHPVSLLAIGQTQKLLDTGMMGTTDAIDPAIALSAVVLKITKDGEVKTYVQDCTAAPLTHFTWRTPDQYRRVEVDYSTKIAFPGRDSFSPVTAQFRIFGAVNLELGDIGVHASDVDSGDYDGRVEVVGYSVNAFRVNHNRKQATA